MEKNNMGNSSAPNLLSNGFKTTTEDIIKATAYAIIMALSMCGNILVLVVVKKNIGGRMRSVSNYLLTSMAAVDLIITLGSMPERLTRALSGDKWLIEGGLGTALCKATNFFEKFSLNVSILNIVLIAIDRYFVVVFPHKTVCTARKVFVALGVVWFSSAVYCSPVLYYGGLLMQNGQTLCKVRHFFPNWRAWYLLFLVELLLTLLLVVLLYASICYKLWRRKFQSAAAIDGAQPHMRKSSWRNAKVNRKVVKMVAVVLVAFYACFLPYWIGWVFCSYHHARPLCNDTYFYIAIFLTYSNSCLNPLIYCALSETFRDAFKLVLAQTCPWILCCRKQVHPHQRQKKATRCLAELAMDSVMMHPRQAVMNRGDQKRETELEGATQTGTFKRENCF